MVGGYFYILGSHTGAPYISVTSNHYPMRTAMIMFSGFGGRKDQNSMGKISVVEVLRLRAIKPFVMR